MMEWLVLLVLVPAIVAPIVLLFGFAGCKYEPQRVSSPPAPPIVVSVVPLDATSARLLWTNPNVEPVTFEIERRTGNDPPVPLSADAAPFVDTSLEGGTIYSYRVRAVRVSDGDKSVLSDPAAIIETWGPAFTSTLVQSGQDLDVSNDGVVQRFDAPSLSHAGNLVGITVRAASNASLALSTVTISEQGGGERFDSSDPVVVVVQSVVVAPGQSRLLPPVSFTVHVNRPLLVAFDVGSVGNARILPVATPGQTAYQKDAPPGGPPVTEAAANDRSGFQERLEQLWLVERIDVATQYRLL